MTYCSISIVIPAYNVENYLDDALNSIKEQSEFPDEVIIIDDGSTDQTLKIATSYDFPFPYRVVSIENRGQGNARNIGIDLSSSEYVYYFDSDDILAKDFIKSIKEQVKYSDSPDIILFSGQSFNDSEYHGDRWVDYKRGFSGCFYDRVIFLDRGISKKGLFCSPCLYISKRMLWGEKGLKFGDNYLEDEAVFYPLLFVCQSFCVIDKVFFYRRNRNDSTMTMIPNSKHVAGALSCIDTTLKLYHTEFYSKREQWHIRKRLEGHCTSYVSMARESGLKIVYMKIFKIILTTRSATLAVKVLFYLVRANESKVIRKIIKLLR